MKNTIISIGFVGLLMAFTQSAHAQCSAGSFTLNFPSSSNITGTSVYLSWTASSSSLGYDVEYRQGSSGTWLSAGSTTSSVREKTVTGLSYGTYYQFRVASKGIESTGGAEPDFFTCYVYSSTRSATTEPGTPTAYSATNVGTNSFTASWSSKTGATSYDIDVSTSSGFGSFVSGYNGLNVSGTSKTVTGLASATTYYYRVRAVNGSGESSNSSYKTVYTIPDVPTVNEASSESQTSFVVSWSAVDRADSYRLDVSTSSSFFTYVSGYQNLSVTGTSKTVTGLTPGTTYYFRLRAYDNAGSTTSGNSSTKNTTTIPDDPAANAASSMTQTSFTANWTTEIGATSFRLDVSESSDFSTYVSGYSNLYVTGTAKPVTGLSNGTTYYYRLRAENASGVSSNSNVIETTTIPNETTAGSASDLAQTSFIANWSAVTGAEGYRLDVSESSTFLSYVSGYEDLDVTGNNHSVTGLNPATTYYYRLRAYNSSGTSGNSSTIETLTVSANPTTQSASSVTSNSFQANWANVTGATGYRLDVSTTSDFSSFVTGYEDLFVSGTSQVVNGLDPATTYYYRVRSENSSGISGNSDTQITLTIPDAPSSLGATSVTQTTFLANWNTVTGATNYRIDVSTSSDFTAFVAGYKNLNVNGLSKLVSGLAQGTTYYYRIKAENATGISTPSSSQEVLTIPANPTAISADNFTGTSFTAHWNSVTGADNYLLDVSTTSDFSEILVGYDNLSVATNSQSIEGLSEGITYYYRVKAENTSGISGTSNTIETITIPSIPVVAAATSHTTLSFVANWEPVIGLNDYLLDVSTSSNFSQMITGFNGLSVDSNTTSKEVTGLIEGQNYYYRVRARNTSGTSNNSSSTETITLPAVTLISGFADHAATKFRMTWEEVAGVEEYEIFIATDAAFNAVVEGYNPLTVQNILTESFIEGLLPNTIYYAKVRSKNASGYSAFSSIKTTSTTNSDGSVVKPSINNFTFNNDQSAFTWSISGGTGGITTALLKHKTLMEQDFTIEEIAIAENGDYQVSLSSEWVGNIGMQYQLYVEDLAGRSAETAIETYYQTIQNTEILINESFGTDYSNYQIISIPYELSTTRIEDLFEGILGSYDKSKWRLLKYRTDNNSYVDYEEGLSVSNVQRGAGYWFISSEKVSLMFGSGETPHNTLDKPFELNLTKGWNQIGNPFLEELNWSDVLAVNSNPSTVGELLTYDPNSVSFVSNDVLSVFGGGFVFVDEDITLQIPIDINQASTSGRLSSGRTSSSTHNSGWELNFTLQQGDLVNQLSGIGMNQISRDGKDEHDVLNPPYFSEFVALKSTHGDFFYDSFAKDIVQLKSEHHWSFQIESSASSPTYLGWKSDELPSGSLILYDTESNKIINMHEMDGYTFEKPNQFFSVYYSDSFIDLDGLTQLGYGYPNPMHSHLSLPHRFHLGQEPTASHLKVFDTNGQVVFESTEENYEQGIRSLQWNRMNQNGQPVPSGLYYYQLQSTTTDQSSTMNGKIVVE